MKASKLKCCNLFMSQVNFHHKPSQLFSKTLSLAAFGTYSFCHLKAELLLRGGTIQKNTWFIWYSNQGRAPRKTFIDNYIAQEYQNRLLYVNLTTECLITPCPYCWSHTTAESYYWLLSSISQQLDSGNWGWLWKITLLQMG